MPPSSIAESSNNRPDAGLPATLRIFIESGVQYGFMAYAFLLPFAKLSHVLEYAFLGLLVIWVVLRASQRELPFRRTSLDVPILLFLGWVLLTTPFAMDPAYSFSEWRKSLTRALMFFFVASAIGEERQVRNILVASVLGCLVQAAGALHSFIGQDAPWHSIVYREAGWTSSSQWLSTYLVMMLPFVYLVFRFERQQIVRWAYVLGAALVLIALFLSHTRAAWVALMVQVLVWGALRFRRSGIQAAVVGALAVCLLVLLAALPGPVRTLFMQEPLTNTSTMLIRFNTWELALDQIAANPVTGLGYGRHSFQHVVPESPPEPLHTHVHNTFLGSAVQLGLPGFALLLWIFARLVRDCCASWKGDPEGFEGSLALAVLLCTVGVVVRNLFDDMFVGTIVYLFWLLGGLHYARKGRRAAQGGRIGAAASEPPLFPLSPGGRGLG